MTMRSKFCFLWTVALGRLVCSSDLWSGYQLIRPVRLHVLPAGEEHTRHSAVLKYRMKVDGRNVDLDLQESLDLLAENYTELFYRANGTRVMSVPYDLDNCYYHGKVRGDPNSEVSISTCDGLRGYIKTGGQEFLIEPLVDGDTDEHVLLRREDTPEDTHNDTLVCGVYSSEWRPAVRMFAAGDLTGVPLVQEAPSASQLKYVELYVVVDNSEYLKQDGDLSNVRKRIFEMINYVYKPLKTFVVLVGLEVWTDKDHIAVSTSAGETLARFTRWRREFGVKNVPHDVAHLITAVSFAENTAGVAYVGTACSESSTGVVQDSRPHAIATGATLAHEIGHNLGMRHDSESCTCSGDTCIMSPTVSHDVPRSFSSCSRDTYTDFLVTREPTCLFNRPDVAAIVSVPDCGNEIVEDGEECDCGPPEECTDPCCDAHTCRLKKGVQCVSGECCENCKLLPHTHTCREKQSECDLAELCTGRDPACPEDVYTENGSPCQSGRGFCYHGTCPIRAQQCVEIWGPDAETANSSCYELNMNGLQSGYCQRGKNGTFIACQQRDVLCGKLFCTSKSAAPRFGEQVGTPVCRATFFNHSVGDLGQVDEGTVCGERLVCSDRHCVTLEEAYGSNCLAKCQGQAICNHKSECQCEAGWEAPRCSTRIVSIIDEGLSPNDIVAIAVGTTVAVVLIALLVCIAVIVTVKWRRRCADAESSPPHMVDVTFAAFWNEHAVGSHEEHRETPKA